MFFNSIDYLIFFPIVFSYIFFISGKEAHGMVIMAAVILFGFQIYFDFQGYTMSVKVVLYSLKKNRVYDYLLLV